MSCGTTLDRREPGVEVALERDVELAVLGARAVIGEVQRLLDQRVDVDALPVARCRRANATACS